MKHVQGKGKGVRARGHMALGHEELSVLKEWGQLCHTGACEKNRPGKIQDGLFVWGGRYLIICGSVDLLFEFFQRTGPENLLEQNF